MGTAPTCPREELRAAPHRPRGAGSGAGAAAAPPSRRSSAVGAGLSRRRTLSPGALHRRPRPLSAAPRRRPACGRPRRERGMDGTVNAARCPRPGPAPPRHVRDAHTGGIPGPGTDPGQRCCCCSCPGAARKVRPAGSLVGSGRTPCGASFFRRRSPTEPRLETPGGCHATLSDPPRGPGLRQRSACLAPAGCPSAGRASSAEPRRLCCLAGTRLARRGRLKEGVQCSFTAPERGLQAPSEGSPFAATGFTERDTITLLDFPILPCNGPCILWRGGSPS